MLSVIDTKFVDAAAPNAGAMKNGRAVALKKIVALNVNPEGDLLFGEIKGSGKSNYFSSADFINPESPVYRCSCPSRQFPCKHALGLLYAVASGTAPKEATTPEEVTTKRGKVAVRAEKKKEREVTPKKVNKAALVKKLEVQMEGLSKLEVLIHDLCRGGIGNIGAKALDSIDQLSLQLSDAYLPGARNGLREFRQYFFDDEQRDVRTGDEQEKAFSDALDQLARLQALCSKGQSYLKARLSDSELKPEVETPIAALLGHAWSLVELKDAGCCEMDVSLMQLAFHSYGDKAREEFVDEGIWLNLSSGAVQRTLGYRPFKASKHIKEDDSEPRILQVPELMTYPGNMNPRIRWETATARQVEPDDYKKVQTLAQKSFAETAKLVKNQLKSPLSEKDPLALLRFSRLLMVGGTLVAEDASGDRLGLEDAGSHDPPSCELLPSLPAKCHKDGSLLVRYHHNIDSRTLRAQPLALVTDESLIRLTF